MPTENRSSNTEMVSVPRDIIEFAVGFKTHGYKNLTEQHTDQRHAQDKLRAILAQPTQQHQGEPVGYQQRTMTDRPGSQWTPWRECCDATRARYSQEVGQINQHGIMREIRPVFASAADPGEVERLRSDLIDKANEMRVVVQRNEGLMRRLAERDALLARVVDHANFWHDHPYAAVVEAIAKDYKALSASAEPSAPVERDELSSMVDAAMVEMAGIHPPLKRSECERLIRAALERKPS